MGLPNSTRLDVLQHKQQAIIFRIGEKYIKRLMNLVAFWVIKTAHMYDLIYIWEDSCYNKGN
jgi:hypothetical protein